MITLGRLSRFRQPRSGWATTGLLTLACLLFALLAMCSQGRPPMTEHSLWLQAPPMARSIGEALGLETESKR